MVQHLLRRLGYLLTCYGLVASSAYAQEGRGHAIEDLTGRWTISVGFGEIPFLSGSFKPSVSLGYHINNYLFLGYTVQLRDVLERGTASFNALDTGLGGVQRTREETGVRSLLAVRMRPHRNSPFISLGLLFNGSDREVMHFDGRKRVIGDHTYQGDLVLEQTRPWAIRPAVGLGYSHTFNTGLSLGIEMAGAFFLPAPEPVTHLIGDPELTNSDATALKQRISSAFKNNFHNRYHLFQMTAGYAW